MHIILSKNMLLAFQYYSSKPSFLLSLKVFIPTVGKSILKSCIFLGNFTKTPFLLIP